VELPAPKINRLR